MSFFSSLTLLFLLTIPSLAQTTPDTTPPDTAYTLHLSSDLIQIPVLVLYKTRRPMSGLTAPDFSIQLESGPIFHSRSTHIQGDDPLSVIVLLDASTSAQRTFLDAVQKHLASLPHNLFRPHDRLSVFAFDCKFVATARDQNVVRIDLTSSTANTSLACLCQPSHINTLAGGAAFRVNDLSTGPLWIADLSGTVPNMIFVPAIH